MCVTYHLRQLQPKWKTTTTRTTTPSRSPLPPPTTTTTLPVPPGRQSPSPQPPALYELLISRPPITVITMTRLKRGNHPPVQHRPTAHGAGTPSPWTDPTRDTDALTRHCSLSSNDEDVQNTPPYIRKGGMVGLRNPGFLANLWIYTQLEGGK